MKELYTKPESVIDEFETVSVLTASDIHNVEGDMD